MGLLSREMSHALGGILLHDGMNYAYKTEETVAHAVLYGSGSWAVTERGSSFARVFRENSGRSICSQVLPCLVLHPMDWMAAND